ncbi:ABC transporter ATP-binding protein [Propionicicella superfundia]|uniref:ABC transporter ATP-binding protein n=1 Tax=Propionicicella superfundia TaxID=348582 RepID=UPI00040C1F57|nr:ABC transporter ATP-binding protein [Propionicicella superfundia]
MTAGSLSPLAARTEDLRKVYGHGEAAVVALAGVTLGFERGKFTAVMGASGSGKSTLMHCVAGLDNPTGGAVFIGDTEIGRLKDKQLTLLRRERIGFVFQSFNLIPTLTADENILLPLSIAGRKPDPEWYDLIIDTVGLRDRLTHKPSELSGGQQQRVACARALMSKPDIVFADEPTGNLDSRSGAEVLAFLRRSVDDFGQTIVMVTHDPVGAAYTDRVVFLADGEVVDELRSPSREDVLRAMGRLEPAGGRTARPATPPGGRVLLPGDVAPAHSEAALLPGSSELAVPPSEGTPQEARRVVED